jgi:hypothetical protein
MIVGGFALSAGDYPAGATDLYFSPFNGYRGGSPILQQSLWKTVTISKSEARFFKLGVDFSELRAATLRLPKNEDSSGR